MKKNETFYKAYKILRKSKKLNLIQKGIIEIVLSYQAENLVCFESNKKLANNLGLTESNVKKHIQILNKFEFFKSEKTSKYNQYNRWENSKQIVIDEEKLIQFLEQEEPIQEKPIIEQEEILKENNQNNQDMKAFNAATTGELLREIYPNFPEKMVYFFHKVLEKRLGNYDEIEKIISLADEILKK